MTKITFDGLGLKTAETIDIPDDAHLREALVRIAEIGGTKIEELHVTLEDHNELIDVDVIVREHPHKHHVHHAHHCREIAVTVNYNGKPAHHRYPPSTRVQTILAWAVAVPEFHIDPPLRTEMQLTLEGSEEPLPAGAHIGRYAKRTDCQVELTLARGDIHQGSAP